MAQGWGEVWQLQHLGVLSLPQGSTSSRGIRQRNPSLFQDLFVTDTKRDYGTEWTLAKFWGVLCCSFRNTIHIHRGETSAGLGTNPSRRTRQRIREPSVTPRCQSHLWGNKAPAKPSRLCLIISPARTNRQRALKRIPQAGLGAGKVPPMRSGSPDKNNAVFRQPPPSFAFPPLANQLLQFFFF